MANHMTKANHMTQNDVYKTHYNTINIGVSGAPYLLKYRERLGYNAGVYGWNADIYSVAMYAIVTGVRSFGTIKADYQTVKDYDNKAKAILTHKTWKPETKRRKVNDLLLEFIDLTLDQKGE